MQLPCTVGVECQLIVTECSHAVTKMTVHHKACVLSREGLWVSRSKFLPGVRIRDQNNESHPPDGQTLGLGERQEGVKLAAVVGSLIELDLRCSQHMEASERVD